MFKGDGDHAWFVIGNPTDTASQMFQEELAEERDGSAAWTTFSMSAPDHPNLVAELDGRPPPYPAAVSLRQFEQWLADWSDRIPADEATATDLEWPPGSGVWYKPGPEMEGAGLGAWPARGRMGFGLSALAGREEAAALRTRPVHAPRDRLRHCPVWGRLHRDARPLGRNLVPPRTPRRLADRPHRRQAHRAVPGVRRVRHPSPARPPAAGRSPRRFRFTWTTAASAAG